MGLGFLLIAEMVRHLRVHPYPLPALLACDWPGHQLRDTYTTFRDQFAQRLRDYSVCPG